MEEVLDALEKSPQTTPEQQAHSFGIEVQKLLRQTLSLGKK